MTDETPEPTTPDPKPPKKRVIDEDGTPKRYWRMKLIISGVSVMVGITVLITRLPRFFIEFEEWSGISVHHYVGIEKPAKTDAKTDAKTGAKTDAQAPTTDPGTEPISTDPAPTGAPAPTPTAPPKPKPKPTPNRDPAFTYVLKVSGKTHTYWYGPPDADRSTWVRTKLIANALWSEFRTQAFAIDATLDAETKLVVTKAMDENADGHLTISELTVARRRGLMGLLGGH